MTQIINNTHHYFNQNNNAQANFQQSNQNSERVNSNPSLPPNSSFEIQDNEMTKQMNAWNFYNCTEGNYNYPSFNEMFTVNYTRDLPKNS